LRGERPDYAYLKDVFRRLRAELGIEVTKAPKRSRTCPPKRRSEPSTRPSGTPVPLGEVARRLGHTVETLVSIYVGALDGDDTTANKLIDQAFGPARAWMANR
jgi:hypothetical protein